MLFDSSYRMDKVLHKSYVNLAVNLYQSLIIYKDKDLCSYYVEQKEPLIKMELI